MFVLGVTSPRDNFLLIYDKRLQLLTSTRHSLSSDSDGSLACHPYCDMEHLCIQLVIFEDLKHSHLLPTVSIRRGTLITCFTTSMCREWGSNSDLLHTRRTLYQLSHRGIHLMRINTRIIIHLLLCTGISFYYAYW